MAYHYSMQLLLVEDELEIQGFLKQSLAMRGARWMPPRMLSITWPREAGEKVEFPHSLALVNR
jgi:hypothetical protein